MGSAWGHCGVTVGLRGVAALEHDRFGELGDSLTWEPAGVDIQVLSTALGSGRHSLKLVLA